MNVRKREERFDEMRQKLFAHPPERETCQRDSKLRRRKICVEMRTNVLREPRPRIPLLRQFVKLTGAHFDDREFAGDEKSVEPDQRGNRQKFCSDNPRRVPLRDRRVSQKAKDRHVHCCIAACLVAERFASANCSARQAAKRLPIPTSWTSSHQESFPAKQAR